MGGIRRGLVLVGLVVAMAAGGLRAAVAQLATTTVQDTVYRADGTAAAGSVVISWGAFTTQNGAAVSAGTTTVTLGAGGALSVALAPNAGSTPMGTYYTAVFHLNDGTTTREYWSVPVTVAGGGPVKLAAISTQVLPASVAMQTVSKAYVDNAIAAAQAGTPFDASPYVLKAGDTMTGPLELPADPVSTNQAADKNYVDENVSAVASGLGQKVSLLPGATQVVSQPTGTQLEANLLNGEVYATQYLSGNGNNGIANAAASADCAAGCELKVEQTYPGTENVPVTVLAPETRVEDARGGSLVETTVDPLAADTNGVSSTTTINNVSVRTAAAMSQLESNATLESYPLQVTNEAMTGGSNQFPEQYESVPYFKTTYGVEQMKGTYNTQGQHVQAGSTVDCYGVGDCLAGSQSILSEGGFRDSADEGVHPFDLSVAEDSGTFTGSCASGCTTGSTAVTVTATAGGGTQGDGRFLMDKNPAKVISAGTLTGGTQGTFGSASFSGTNFAVSVMLASAQAATSQPKVMAPGTVTLAIETTGAPAGYATNTAALPAPTGVACVSDGGGLPNFETANYSVVDGTHVTLTLNKVHGAGATIAVGGLCGYGLEETVDTRGAVKQVFPVVGSVSATSLYYAQASTAVVGVFGQTGGYLNYTVAVASIARTGNVVTVTTASNLVADVQGLTMTVSGVADSSYDGTFAVTTTGPNTLTYANAGANSTSSGGSLSVVTGGFNLYPMAEVLSVYDPSTKTVDGKMTLAPNTVAWAAGDAVEEPHFYQERVAADVEYITQYVPRTTLRQSAGKYYQGVVGPQLYGWEISNGEAASDYVGAGGTHTPPTAAYSAVGYWANDFTVAAGRDAVMRVYCNVLGCNRWDSEYALFALDSATGTDVQEFYPQNDTVTWSLAGTQYSFSPTGFTAGTINVGTLNATTIMGGVAGSAITSGTVSAARLPVFGPSGTSHAAGIVPDPGATAGATRYLREDGTWNVPAGGGTGPGTVTSFAAPAASWPSWLTPAVTNASTTPSEAVTANAAANTMLGNWTGSAGGVTANAMPSCSAAGSVLTYVSGTGMTCTSLATYLGAYLASPPAIGGTAAGSIAGTTGMFSTSVSVSNASTISVALGSMYAPLLGVGSHAAYGFGISGSPGNSGYLAFYRAFSGVNFASVETYGGASPLELGGSSVVIPNCLMVNNGATVSSGVLGNTCSGTTALAVNGGSTFMVDTSGNATTPQVIAGGGAPTMAAGAGAGTSASCAAIAGANMAGVIACTTGTSTVAGATVATVTFSGTLGTAPRGCTLMARNAASAAASGTVYTTAPTTAGWTIAAGANALAASTAYSWSYSCE